jgi:hypothetical protein
VFTLAVVANVFIAPWWLTVGWALVGCLLFPVYLEAVVIMLFFDTVFSPGGLPTLALVAIIGVAFSGICHFYVSSNQTEDVDSTAT